MIKKLILFMLLSFCLVFSASAWNTMVTTSGTSTAAAGQIVYDTSSQDAGVAWGASVEWDHTVASQSNLVLVVLVNSTEGGGVWEAGDCLADKGSSPTSMVLVSDQAIGSSHMGMYYMLAPDTGNNTITCTPSTAGELMGIAATFYDVKQQAPEASEGSTGAGVKLISDSITTITDDAWVISGISAGEEITMVADYGETKRVEDAYSGWTLSLFTEEIASNGANTFGAGESTGTVSWKIILISLEEN